MKKLYFLVLLFSVFVQAQSYNQNFVRTVLYKMPTTSPVANPTADFANVQISYFDGLGRPIQQIAVQQSQSGKDIVTHLDYDLNGRQPKDYLPYVGNGTPLAYDENAKNNQNSFYSAPDLAQHGNPTFEATLNPFSEKKFEASPLNRVLKQAAPGDAWAMNNGHEIKMDYQTNTVADIVKFFKVNTTYNTANFVYDIALTQNGSYAFSQLYKTITKDENWTSGQLNTVEEFKNKQGQVVLKRTFNSGSTSVQAIHHDTYYVYDKYGNLTFVIPPLADDPTSINVLNGLCYQYKYDMRNRLVEKKLPGKQWEFIVYDKLDRVVATGPTLAPFQNMVNLQGWLVTKYDIFNRAVVTAWTPFTSRVALQGIYSGATTFNEVKATTPSTLNGVNFNYTNNVYPTVGYHVLTINYYDDYNFNGAPTTYSVMLDGQEQAYYNNTIRKPKGLPTGSWVRVLQTSDDSNAEISYSIYDSKSRVVSQTSTNYLNGATRIDSKLDFSGKTLYTLTKHQRDATSTPLQIREDFTYTAQDRLLTHTHEVVGHTATELLAQNDYDELGQLIKKSVGGSDPSGAASLQKVDYSYNIRGWLKSINQINELTPASDPTDLFAFSISYNEVIHNLGGAIKPLYNGNISETFWKTDSDNVIRNYGYQYDNLNRLTASIYQRNGFETHSYDETLNYDKNGNILKLDRNGYFDTVGTGTSYPIDELYYGYAANSNKLLSVYDQTNSTEGFKDGNMSGNDYDYDANGNMIEDKNKNISKIYYNHLNLPVKIEFGTAGQNEITYLYNAAGVKVGKKVITTNPGVSKVLNSTDYFGGFQYLNNELKFFPTAEGYVSVTGGDKFNYVYNYTDHLGNIRLSYSKENGQQELKILEQNHYYPFGLKHSYNVDTRAYGKTDNGAGRVIRPVARSNYQYKYNGKEYQDELGLNVTAMDFRQYDPAIGRFNGMDRLTELVPNMSPYRFAFNNPVYWNDPTGLMEQNSEEHCPTCPNTPAFQPLIDDPNNEYVYDPETNSATLVIELEEVVVSSTDNNSSNGLEILDFSYGFAGDYGKTLLDNGSYKQTNGNTGNFNDRAFKRLSQNAKAQYNFAKNLKALKKAGIVTTVILGSIEVSNGAIQDYKNYTTTGSTNLKNTTVASVKVGTAIAVGWAAGAATGALIGTAIPIPLVGTLVGAIVGGVAGYYASEATGNLVEKAYE